MKSIYSPIIRENDKTYYESNRTTVDPIFCASKKKHQQVEIIRTKKKEVE